MALNLTLVTHTPSPSLSSSEPEVNPRYQDPVTLLQNRLVPFTAQQLIMLVGNKQLWKCRNELLSPPEDPEKCQLAPH